MCFRTYALRWILYEIAVWWWSPGNGTAAYICTAGRPVGAWPACTSGLAKLASVKHGLQQPAAYLTSYALRLRATVRHQRAVLSHEVGSTNLLMSPPCLSAHRRSLVKDGKGELLKSSGVGDEFVPDDLLVLDRDGKGEPQPSARRNHNSHCAIDERQLGEPRIPSEDNDLLRDGSRTADLCRSPRRQGSPVGPPHNVGRQHRDNCADVAGARSSEEGLDHVPVPGKLGAAHRGSAAYPVPRAAGELLRGYR